MNWVGANILRPDDGGVAGPLLAGVFTGDGHEQFNQRESGLPFYFHALAVNYLVAVMS